MPVHLLSRRILEEAGGCDEALALARAADVTASTSLTFVDGAGPVGHAVCTELFPGGPGVVEPDDGLLLRTNHFLSAAGAPGDLADSIGPGSRIRLMTLHERLDGRADELKVEDVYAAMADHRDVGGVCRHPEPELPAEQRSATLATVALDVTAGRLSVAAGGPCGLVGDGGAAAPQPALANRMASSSSGESAWSQDQAATFLA
jgi:isopenicillin-N N-acyltransferase-like protein